MTIQHIVEGAGAPAAVPPSIGAHYIDTTSGAHYIAKGTVAAADWVALNKLPGWAESNAAGYAALTPAAGGTASVVLAPSGTGGVRATVDGNARGAHSVDLQTNRAFPTQAASGAYAVLAGGHENESSGDSAVVAGGWSNTATAVRATVAGGQSNLASGSHASVGGGWSNTASGIEATVNGGRINTASGLRATVAGGYDNNASADNASIGGGSGSRATQPNATVAGGSANIASGTGATVSGGFSNQAQGAYAAVAGGSGHLADGDYSAVAGGKYGLARGTLGAVVHGGSAWSSAGAQQFRRILLAQHTINATAASLTADSLAATANNVVAPPYWGTVIVTARVVARSVTGISSAWEVECVIAKGDINTIAIVGTPAVRLIAQSAEAAGWGVTVSADTVLDALQFQVTGGATDDIYWNAAVELVEITA